MNQDKPGQIVVFKEVLEHTSRKQFGCQAVGHSSGKEPHGQRRTRKKLRGSYLAEQEDCYLKSEGRSIQRKQKQMVNVKLYSHRLSVISQDLTLNTKHKMRGKTEVGTKPLPQPPWHHYWHALIMGQHTDGIPVWARHCANTCLAKE